MALNNFLSINMPYGFFLEKGKAIPFNRESSPLGSNIPAHYIEGYRQIWEHANEFKTEYKGLTTRLIEDIATSIIKTKKGDIEKFYLYDDSTNPNKSAKDLEKYLNKLSKLFKLRLNV
tara:strand:+ start:356 stop:709 length:354 start_codon:yes stop_codon:yes gene_type:complete